MRSEEEIIDLILRVAEENKHIRAALLTGSRANPKVAKDRMQDYDVIYIVTQIERFTDNHNWVDVFGERLIMQLPDEMSIGVSDRNAFHYLMLFTDGNRIDLTLILQDKLDILFQESQLKLLLDKDNILRDLPLPNEKNHLIQPPLEKEFKDCCNEFWWVSTYVAKGLWRKELVYAKAMLEGPVRTMFLQMIEWYVGIIINFNASFGKYGRNLQRFISPELYNRILATYPNADIDATWTALFRMTDLFDELANKIATELHFQYDKEEAGKVVNYLHQILAMPPGK